MEDKTEHRFKTEWTFVDDQGRDWKYWLRVDEHSSEQEIEEEMEYWMKQIKVYQLDGAHKSALMQAVRWMMGLTQDGD